MCLLGLAYQVVPGCPLFVFANREEDFGRPTALPRIETDPHTGRRWLGGIDLAAGGTWLGVNDRGLLVAVTNRQRTTVPLNPRSRGLLCRELLGYPDARTATAAALRALDPAVYAGCNLVVVDRDHGQVIEAGDVLQQHPLAPGLHLLTNGSLNAVDDVRLRRVRAELRHADWPDARTAIRSSQQICGATADGTQPAICLEGTTRGTVSSTIVALTDHPLDAEYWYAAGPPARVPYVDYSATFQSLLASGADAGDAASVVEEA